MLTEKQLEEIRAHLEKAQNPLFLFDNDVDGLISFLVLQRFLGRGKGVAIKSSPDLDKNYFRKVNELHPDYIFVLDKPGISDDFIELVKENNLPLVHIDHHNVPESGAEFYYNTYQVSKKNEPTSYLAYQITQNKKDEWLALIGCIADSYIPDFTQDFKEKNPDLIAFDYKSAFDIYYNTKIGEIIRILSFGLLDRTTNVVKMMKFLMKVQAPYDILEENPNTASFLNRYEEVYKKYKVILDKANSEVNKNDKLLFFTYSGDLSISQEISNELSYHNPKKVIVVGYLKNNEAKFSLRGPFLDVRKLTLNAIEGIEGAVGGGHTYATGAKMLADQVPQFKENIKSQLKI